VQGKILNRIVFSECYMGKIRWIVIYRTFNISFFKFTSE
jgi:hypothetical protein